MTESRPVGHLVLTDRGQMLAPDAGFCAMLHMAPRDLVGRSVLEVTRPDDRAACVAGMAKLRETRQAFIVTKHMVCADGSTIRVEQTTAMAAFGDAAPQVMATVVPIDLPPSDIGPAALLAQARFLRESRRDRDALFGSALFGNPAWDLLLKAYIAEAEGRPVDILALAVTARIPSLVAWRWARALATEGLFEIETGGGAAAPSRYRLTAAAHDRIERYLSERLTKLTSLSVIA